MAQVDQFRRMLKLQAIMKLRGMEAALEINEN